MRRLHNARERAHAAAQQTRGEAFTFVRTRRGNLVEVRVQPDGDTTYTLVDAQGRPTGTARSSWGVVARKYGPAAAVGAVVLAQAVEMVL